jgi:hypothetical protein
MQDERETHSYEVLIKELFSYGPINCEAKGRKKD